MTPWHSLLNPFLFFYNRAMATPAQLFFKKVILSIINFVKKNWFILILIGLTIVLFCALLKDNIEEPFDSTPLPINPDATNPLLTEGNIYGIIPYEASANLYNTKEIIDQGNAVENGPAPKKDFNFTLTSFTFDSTEDNSEAKLAVSINTTIINEMAKSTTFGGNGTTATPASLAAATASFNSIMGITATSSNTNGLVQGGLIDPGPAAAFGRAQEIAADKAKDKAQEMAIERAKLIGTKIRPAVTAAASAGAAAIVAGINYIRGVPVKAPAPKAAIAIAKKADKTLLKRVGPAAKKIALAIGKKIAEIIAGRTTAMHALAALLGATGVGFLPAAIIEIIANICTGLNLAMSTIMAGVLMGSDPQCSPGYTLLSDNIPKNILDALEPIPIIGDILGMLAPAVCWINACPSGTEEDGGLCYDKCESGYHGVGPLCWSDNRPTIPSGPGVMRGCPSTHNDIGLICSHKQTLAPIGKFDNNPLLACPSDRPDFIDGLCYGRCSYATPAYQVTTKYPRFIRVPNTEKINTAKDQLETIKRLANNTGTLNDLWVIYWATHGFNGSDGQYWWKNTPANGAPTGTLAQYNSLMALDDDVIPDEFLPFINITSPTQLTVKQKGYFNYLINDLNTRYNYSLKEQPFPTNNFIANPVVPVPNPANFTEPPPVQEPEFKGTYQKCTGNANQWVPPIPGHPKIPAVAARAYVPAVQYRQEVRPVAAWAEATELGQYLIPAGKWPDPLGNGLTNDPTNTVGYYLKLFKDGAQYQPSNGASGMAWVPVGKAPIAPYYNLLSCQSCNPNGFVITVIGAIIHPAIPGIPGISGVPEIPAIQAQPEIPAVAEIPGYYKDTRVCQTLPAPNPLYNPKQYATEYAAWQTKKYNTPPPASTPDSAIPTWEKVENFPEKYTTDHLPGMPYQCVGKRGITYGRGAGRPKLDIQMPRPYTAPADPPPAQSADNFAEISNFKCNSDYKSTYALELMCNFYYKAARIHAAEEAYSPTGARPAVGTIITFTYIKSITKVKASSERSCDVICQMASKTLTITSISPFIFTTSSTTTSIAGNTDRRFYFGKIPALCNLKPSNKTLAETPIPSKLSYIPFACTNTPGFALEAIASDASYTISTYTYTAPIESCPSNAKNIGTTGLGVNCVACPSGMMGSGIGATATCT